MLQSLETHTAVTPALAAVLRHVALGATDEEIAEILALKVGTIRSRLRRFYRSTGLSGRRVVAWAARHETCCIGTPGPSSTASQNFRDTS
jgi:DNA-binding NarL/FixJ family response regulator